MSWRASDQQIMAKFCGSLLVLLASISSLARGGSGNNEGLTSESPRAPAEPASQLIGKIVIPHPAAATTPPPPLPPPPTTTTTSLSTSQQSAIIRQNSAQGKPERPSSKATSRARHKSSSQTARCDYLKEPWTECQANGLQERRLRLKGGQAANCEPIRLIRRECRQGCKYKRGEWSSRCRKGVRTRIDTLLSGPSNTSSVVQVNELAGGGQAACQAQRRVTKDCRRTCHYIRSAWSDCGPDGYRTRNLTLSDSAANCVQWRQTKRPCRRPDGNAGRPDQTKVRPTKRRKPQHQATPASGQVAPPTTSDSVIAARTSA